MKSKMVIIMSRCRSIECNKGEFAYSFPLRGAFKGAIVKSARIMAQSSQNIIPGKDYILGVNLLEVSDENIICKLVKFKRIN